jgi:oligoendopeptidase F
MLKGLPSTYDEVKDWSWEKFQPFAQELLDRELTDETSHEWLTDFSQLYDTLSEVMIKAEVANTQNTADEVVENRLNTFLEQVLPPFINMTNDMNKKIIAAEIEPQGFGSIMRNLIADVELFREENLPLIPEDQKIGNEYNKLVGGQTINWEGEEITIDQTGPLLQNPDRAVREKLWRTTRERQLQDREKLNELYGRAVTLRDTMARNAGLPNYVAYAFKSKHRFDYTPNDVETFRNSIEKAIVPAATRIYQKRAKQMGVDSFRPWDELADPFNRTPLRPYQTIDELNDKVSSIFHQVDPELGGYYDEMRERDALDLENRKNKAPGGYNTQFPVERLPFIFMNAVGIHDNVQTLLHEGGHAFHCFETNALDYAYQREYPIEMAEVASMSMELLGMPYLEKDKGGFYTAQDAARARIEHLEGMILFWPYMSVVDAFQTWAYTNVDQATNAANCDAAWSDIWDRFMPGIDYSGLDEIKKTGWHRKLHIFGVPMYYVEYGIAQLASTQVWANSLKDPQKAIADYRRALSLGGTAILPELYGAAGAKLAFDVDTLQTAANLIEKTVAEQEKIS